MTDFSTLALSFAFALVYLEISVFKRAAWEDDKTGYYNEKYARVIMDYVSEKGIQGGTIIRFSTGDDSEALASILHTMEPDNSKTMHMGGGVFLIVTETQPETVIEWYTNLVPEQAKNAGIRVNADHFTRTDEPPEKFLASCMRAGM